MRLLDLFCCEGGAGTGYHRAGFDVTGVDIVPRPVYPFTFRQADAFELLEDVDYLQSFDLVHASPPCQGYTTMSNRWRGHGGKADTWERGIAATRAGLQAAGVPYIIENVVGARAEMRAPVLLRGGDFGLEVDRPRLFESNLPIAPPPPGRKATKVVGVYGSAFTEYLGLEARFHLGHAA